LTAPWFLAAISAICFAIFLYPYLLYPLVLRGFSRSAVNLAPVQMSISLLFAAYNEVEALPAKLDNLRDLKRARPDIEILVYDDGSTDGTTEQLESVPELVTLHRGRGRSGKASGMKRLAAAAHGDILVFTDANVLLAPDALDRLLPYYADNEVGGVCGTLIYLSDAESVTSHVGSLYWRLDERLRTAESETGNVMGADGSIFSIRRALYPSFPDTVLDDLTVSMSVIFARKRLIKAPDVIAYERSVAERQEEFRRKIRIGARAFHTHRFLRPQLRMMSARDRFKYGSHKLVRWFGGVFLASGMISGLAAVALFSPTAAGVLILVGLTTLGASQLFKIPLVGKATEIALATFATLIGVVQAMRGRTFTTWAPAKSR
jgi:cellulose synthase/poly-beta-1,6-N-acetylglucosamine synthase-like glycosyltransferase